MSRLPSAVVKLLGTAVLVGVVLVCAVIVDVVVVVHLLCLLLCLALGLLAIEPVLALGLGKLVDLNTLVHAANGKGTMKTYLSTCKASKQLLGEGV